MPLGAHVEGSLFELLAFGLFLASVKGDRSVNGPSQASLLARTVLRTLAHSHVVVCLLGGIFNVTGWQKCLPSFVESSLKVNTQQS